MLTKHKDNHIHIFNHYVIHLKFIQCSMSITFNKTSRGRISVLISVLSLDKKPSADLRIEKLDMRSIVCQAFSHI